MLRQSPQTPLVMTMRFIELKNPEQADLQAPRIRDQMVGPMTIRREKS
jgi:hypothetical protein